MRLGVAAKNGAGRIHLVETDSTGLLIEQRCEGGSARSPRPQSNYNSFAVSIITHAEFPTRPKRMSIVCAGKFTSTENAILLPHSGTALLKILNSTPITAFNSDHTLYMIHRLYDPLIASQIDIPGTTVRILYLYRLVDATVVRAQQVYLTSHAIIDGY